ncbi:MAG TPA: hemolysin family protein [bacterium]|jgi:putative hemolysin|nr:hemolysin family protein [bacterium]
MDVYLALNLIILGTLLLASMFFSAVETSLLSFPKPILQGYAEKGGLLGRAFKEWQDHPNRILSTILIGNNAVSVGATTLVAYMAVHLSQVNQWSLAVTGTVSSISITFVIVVFCEALPKIMARNASMKIATLLVIPIYALDKLMTPFTWALVRLFHLLLPRMGNATVSQVTEEDIKQMMEMGQEAGTIQENEKNMIDSIFKFSDTKVNSVMIPRTEMVSVDINTNLDVLVDHIIQNGYSRMPVYKGSVDNIVGIINTRDLLAIWKNKELIVLKDLLHKPYFAPETMRVDRLLREFQRGKIHMAIVVDEYGGTAGLVTLEDLVEEIVGEIRDEYDVDEQVLEKKEDGSWVAEAGVSLDEVNDTLGIHLAPKGDVSSLGGYVTEKTGRVPKKGRVIEDVEAVFSILEASDKKVIRIKIVKREVPLPEPEPEVVVAPKRRKKRVKLPPPVEEKIVHVASVENEKTKPSNEQVNK